MNDDERIKLAIQLVFPTKGLKWLKNSDESAEFAIKVARLAAVFERATVYTKKLESTKKYKENIQQLRNMLDTLDVGE